MTNRARHINYRAAPHCQSDKRIPTKVTAFPIMMHCNGVNRVKQPVRKVEMNAPTGRHVVNTESMMSEFDPLYAYNYCRSPLIIFKFDNTYP